jgi:Fe-S-cluster-containing dehydrogenase component/DMSO reductase anchor subunit
VTLLSAVEPVDETPVDRFLAEQADLTAVERFAQRHAAELVPRQARYYRDLIPFAAPEPGQQYGFEVDLDACTGCKACVAACHSLNGLDDGESWRSVTVLTGGTTITPFQQTVTAACHHCVDPACLNGCPVDAYEKDPVTGIVSHLDDQCIGCSYCTLSCPYEVPRQNKRQGIVRKCDMCSGRLATGEAPACVQSCPNGAIAIKVVDVTDVVASARDGAVVPGAPPSSITVPTSVYRTAKGQMDTGVRPPVSSPAQSHPPLAVMLVLTQLSVGAFVTDFLLRTFSDRASATPFDAALAVVASLVAVGASVFHLGRPRYCYRAVIGFRHSWLSREIVAFGAFTGVAALDALVLWLGWFGGRLTGALGGVAALFGIAGVACSVLIYTSTRRTTWRPATVTSKFVLTAAVCGLATVLWASVVTSTTVPRGILALLAMLLVLKLALELVLRSATGTRVAAALVGGVAVPLVFVGRTAPPLWIGVPLATLMVAGVVAGELLERFRFFTASAPPR